MELNVSLYKPYLLVITDSFILDVIPGKTRSCYSSIRKQSDTEWDDNDIDFTCADNENDPLEKLLGFKPEIDARICKFFNSSGGCKAKDKCAFRHVSYGME